MPSFIRELQGSLTDRPPWHLALVVWFVYGVLDNIVTIGAVAYYESTGIEANPLLRPYLVEAHWGLAYTNTYWPFAKPFAVKLFVATLAAVLLLIVARTVPRRMYAAFATTLAAIGVGVTLHNLLALGRTELAVVVVCLTVAVMIAQSRAVNLPSRRQVFAVALAIAMVLWTPALLTGMGGIAPIQDHEGVAAAAASDEEWKFNAGGTVNSPPTVVDGTVYFSGGGSVYAVDTATGDLEWEFTGTGTNGAVNIADGTLYFHGDGDGELYALDAATGDKLWNTTVGSSQTSPTVANGVVYVGSSNNNTYAIDGDTGAVNWKFDTGGSIDFGTSPTIDDGTVYIGNENGDFHALDADTGAQEWSYSIGNRIRGSPTVGDGKVYLGAHDQQVHALDKSTGSLEWTYTAASYIVGAMTYYEGTVYGGSRGNYLYSLDATDGSRNWRYNTGDQIKHGPTVTGDTAYVGSINTDSALYAVDTSTGDLKWSASVGDDIRYSAPTVYDGTAYVGSADNYLYAIDTGVSGEKSIGHRVLYGTVGHTDDFSADGTATVGAALSGQVTDQYNEPVQNATVAATEIDRSNTINIGSRTLAGIYDDPTPAAWNQQVNDLESFDESQFNPDFGTGEFDEQRVLMHSRADWEPQDFSDYAFYSPRVYEGKPPENIPARPVLGADQEAVFACWTPDGSLFQDGIDRSIPGAETTDCTITVEQIDPLGNRVESRTVESQPVHSVEHPSNAGEDGWLTKKHHAATLDLDPGVYKVYPDGAPEDALYYSIAEDQDPANLRPGAENWQSACDSGSTSQPWHDKVCDKLSSIGTDRATTNATGHYELYMDPSNVDSVQLTAVKDASLDAADETMTADEVSTQFETTVESNFKAHEAATSGPRQYLENNDRESFRQICREMPSVGEEVGAPFFGLAESSVPSSSADIQGMHGTAPYADNVIKECAAANMVEDILNDNLGWLDGGFLDDLDNMDDPHEKLEELLPLLLADPALQEEVEDRTGITLDSSSPYDYTTSEARQILDEGGSALDGGSGGAGAPYVGGGSGSVDDAAGTISETWPVVGVDDWSEAAIMVRLDWSNGTTTTLNESSEHVVIDESVVGADEVRLEDYPLGETDPAAVKPRLDVSTPDGSDGDERPGRRNPHFDGQIPGLKHVKLSSVRPGPDESVTVEVDGDDGLQGLQRVEVTNPDGSTSTVTPTDGTATVTTSGEGTHRLEVVVTNPGGTEFVEVLRLKAGSSASDRPPTVRAATGVTGRYAVASDGMQGASVDVSNGASQVDVVGLLKTDSPGQVVVDTASASIAPDVTHNVELRHGDDEQRLGTSTGLVLRQPPTSEAALHYREGRPITTSGGTEGTVTRTDNATVYDTYTDGDGTLTTRTIDDPGILQRIWFNVRVRSPVDPGSIGDSTGMVAPNTGVAA